MQLCSDKVNKALCNMYSTCLFPSLLSKTFWCRCLPRLHYAIKQLQAYALRPQRSVNFEVPDSSLHWGYYYLSVKPCPNFSWQAEVQYAICTSTVTLKKESHLVGGRGKKNISACMQNEEKICSLGIWKGILIWKVRLNKVISYVITRTMLSDHQGHTFLVE